MRELHNVLLSEMTTLGLGGTAARVIDAETEQELADAITALDRSGEPLFVLGGGSNVVVDDDGWPGTVLRPALRGIDSARGPDGVRLRIGAGETWDALVDATVEQGWSGLACLSGIPGWCGAAPLQNVGAYGHEVGDVLLRVRAYDRERQRFVEFERDMCGFGYRTSIFRHNDRFIVSQIELLLAAGGDETVRYPELARKLGLEANAKARAAEVRHAVLELRRGKGMVVDASDAESRSAGSFFVNPVVDYASLSRVAARAVALGFVRSAEDVPRYAAAPGRWKVPAAWLIERAGFGKGTAHGGVGISRKHALALVNRGGTTAELLALHDRIKQAVFDTFGVELSREPIVVRYGSR